jgi:iron-sulfur cluster repair protein YtfE (RIC family)
MSTQTALPTLLDSSRHNIQHTQQGKLKIQKPSKAQAQVPLLKSCTVKKPQSREEKLLLLPHNGIRFLMDEFLDAVQNMDPSLNWKWENLKAWYDEYFYLTLQQHRDAEENIYFPWIQATNGTLRHQANIPVNTEQQHPTPMKMLDVISELIREGRLADHSQKSGIQTHLCQVVEELVDKMHAHLDEQEKIVPRLMKRAGCTRAEQDAVMMETIQSLTFNSNKVVLPIMVHALELSSGSEKAKAFVQNLPLPDRFLYSSSWAPDFQSRHQRLIRSVHRDEVTNPETSHLMGLSLKVSPGDFHEISQ